MHRGGLGVSDAFTRRCLPAILARFGESEPNTRVEITRGASCELASKLAGDLDLMLCEGGTDNSPATTTAAKDRRDGAGARLT
jgi:DNA-binding transcriptional LysR family regulator